MTIKKLSVPFAFVVVLIIWSTTPLAIKWSSADAPMVNAFTRIMIGALFSVVVLGLSRDKLIFNRHVVRLYAFNAGSIFFGMTLFYIAAQHIPSGWIAVLFGLSPIMTGLISTIVEPETRLTPSALFGIALGFGGLYLVFSAGLNVEHASLLGVTLSLIATLIASITSVVIRQMVKPLTISGMQITTGSLLIAMPLFAIAAWFSQPSISVELSPRALWSTIYLGLIGTGVGFSLYYFLLKHVTANRVSMITLVTPITALMLGSWIDHEPLVGRVWLGAALVCIGLLIYEFKPKLGLRKL